MYIYCIHRILYIGVDVLKCLYNVDYTQKENKVKKICL